MLWLEFKPTTPLLLGRSANHQATVLPIVLTRIYSSTMIQALKYIILSRYSKKNFKLDMLNICHILEI